MRPTGLTIDYTTSERNTAPNVLRDMAGNSFNSASVFAVFMTLGSLAAIVPR